MFIIFVNHKGHYYWARKVEQEHGSTEVVISRDKVQAVKYETREQAKAALALVRKFYSNASIKEAK